MNEDEEILRITDSDIEEANQLSLACPICVGAVENGAGSPDHDPVVCDDCDTLYHRACWEQNGGKCAILGCSSTTVHPYGVTADLIRISIGDVPSEQEANRYNKRIKSAERERMRRLGQPPVQSPQSQGFWQSLLANIARAFGFRRSP